MSGLSVGELARRAGISRSTLLHYERRGLLRPSGRSAANYRLYRDTDLQRLLRIRELRALGIELAVIGRLLDSDGRGVEEALRQRFDQLSDTIALCRRQQRELLALLQGCDALPAGAMDKAGWTALMRASGMGDDDMWRWHAEFEQRAPEGHRQFLLGLGVDDAELARIRRWSRDYPADAPVAVE